MCGIAGSAGVGVIPSTTLRQVFAQLAHRGPDGTGTCESGGVHLCHTRLSIIDLEGGAQPLITADESVALVANGEIYNHLELRRDLEQLGAKFATDSDCEVILHGYCQWGVEVLQRLEGMFAFALHDRKSGQVLLARDPLGMKPLFLASTPSSVIFGSEIKALMPLLNNKPEVNPLGLLQFLEMQHSSGSTTPIAGVDRVLAGEAVLIRDSRVERRWRYWQIADIGDAPIEDPIAAFDRLMETVFTQHLRSDVPIGLFLSGGVDSTILLGLMRRFGVDDIRAFSLGFPGSSVGDELEIATELARHFGVRQELCTPDSSAMLERLVTTVWAADDLMRDAANLPTLMLAETASADMKVVFSGEGGDEAFAGYGRYRVGRVERLLKSWAYPGTEGFRSRGDFQRGFAGSLYGDRLSRIAGDWRQPLTESSVEFPGHWTALQRVQALDLTHALPNNLLVKADRMLMACGVEGRMPFVDRRIVEFGLRLPDTLKIRQKSGKAFLKDWAATFMPSEHFQGKKRGFHVPISDWMTGEYLQRVGRTLVGNAAINEWFKRDGVEALIQRQAHRGDVARHVMALLQFAIWHRLMIEQPGGSRPAAIDPVDFLEASR
ncbi:asparagine synthase [Luminiphilus syltensis NOR5-1B]|uniref:asparagine synthase (glutamine-hydrolyzing) n=1 Tax=Luminiphilus syltensis NOR5-1B TaxID=565045 RepID=B8KQP7_9GAMM|nr:asparagine synthase (glutamine-hydrolyzing) [Luminiphilus syltensis]EED34286.1 asparagine synthase [Luminiphilus syltensis NOR5-1B]